MIIDFTIKNFRSYRDETTFTYEALDADFNNQNVCVVELEDGEKIRLLKSAAIFGANASGKSNVIWALHALLFLVRGSRTFSIDDGVVCYLPFFFEKRSLQLPVEFTIQFIVNKRRYQYQLMFDGDAVLKECLDVMKQNEWVNVFQRVGKASDKIHTITIGTAWEAVQQLNTSVLANQLFLSIAGTMPDNQLLDIYTFLSKIEAEPVADSIDLKQKNEAIAGVLLKENKKLFEQLRRLIHIADLGISNVNIVEHKEEEFRFPDNISEESRRDFIQNNKWEFALIHPVYDEGGIVSNHRMPIRLESTGTKNLFGVGARVLDVLNRGGVLAYDEMNIALHPALFHLLVELFHNPHSNPHNAQLLFTTLDSSIAGQSILRADQIWFAEKSKEGVSQLYSAQDFEDIGINVPFDSWYRSGRFGALPKFGNVDYIFEEDDKKA